MVIKASPPASPDFSFTSPAPRRQRFQEDADTPGSDAWLTRTDPSPIVAPRFEAGESNADDGWSFAHSHFRRRNRLETRLEELQKDVASLTLKLRNNRNRSASLDASSFVLTPAEEVSSYKTPRAAEKRRKSVKEGPSGPVRGGVKTLRELHHVTTERDQLKFELEKTRRALSAAEKKSQEALRAKKALEKLKTHCDSLQESLELSERIRVRQKKLLQQLQLQRKEKETKVKKRPASAGTRSVEKRGASGLKRSTPTSTTPKHADSSIRDYAHTRYDILDSLVASSHHQDEDEEEEEEGGRETHEQAPSEPTAAASRPRTPRSVLKHSVPAKQYRPDFDSLLQVDDVPQFSTRRPSRITTATARRPSQTQVQQRDAMRQAARWARSRGAAVDISTSTTQLPTRRTPTSARTKNSFLAPTQASMRRLHDLPRRGAHERPPFVV
ncbi:hypothetical protein PF005_g3019 [Phytophthora fragariae]|uniref:Uncharacterized protein n=1 Tax=Phytophthora fragariae TaxID=53985 RepID=A0A6A3ZBK6_9STRA|nr:hypothetical protein PF003_g21821 [Phytophthora fragariae]KAE8947108.1 hypothetical protein PF009_g3270 [Phytophthora fragariae]KAE9111642.1 hypothetical protein PF010_g10733 [Phytophthora fragariae]KAE9133238.1 hypothetical protein PF007_g3421 [Phytophthora fragariae]KAE9152840.1 hypothetical protein PF006_g2970 [Phytophthora fragariae]